MIDNIQPSVSDSYALHADDEAAFDVLYCIAFEMVDAQWLAMNASYMQFNVTSQLTQSSILCFQFLTSIIRT